MKIKFIHSLSLVLLLFTGCASPQQLFHFPDQSKVVEDPSKGRIYVIRPKLTGIGIPSEISDDGESIGNTGPRSFLCWERKPGNATISGETDNTSEVNVNVQPGEVTYIIQTLHFGWITTDNRLDTVNEDEGKEALKKCKPPFSYFPSDVATNSATVTK
jgi:hypothetical protein